MSMEVDDRKQLHSLSWYVRMGYPKSTLYREAHKPNGPFKRFAEKGTFYAEKDKLDAYLDKLSEGLR